MIDVKFEIFSDQIVRQIEQNQTSPIDLIVLGDFVSRRFLIRGRNFGVRHDERKKRSSLCRFENFESNENLLVEREKEKNLRSETSRRVQTTTKNRKMILFDRPGHFERSSNVQKEKNRQKKKNENETKRKIENFRKSFSSSKFF